MIDNNNDELEITLKEVDRLKMLGLSPESQILLVTKYVDYDQYIHAFQIYQDADLLRMALNENLKKSYKDPDYIHCHTPAVQLLDPVFFCYWILAVLDNFPRVRPYDINWLKGRLDLNDTYISREQWNKIIHYADRVTRKDTRI